MGTEEKLQLQNLSDHDLLILIIDRQNLHVAVHEKLENQLRSMEAQIATLKESRAEQRGASKAMTFLAALLGAIGTLLGIKNGLS